MKFKSFQGGFFFCLFLALFSGCTNPVDDIKIIIDGDIIKNTALIRISDPQNPETIPSGITITVSGKDSASIYEISGKKNFIVKDGCISLGIDPGRVITEADPAECILTISAPGYLSASQPLSFAPDLKQQIIAVNLIKAENPPAGVSVVQKTASLNKNVLNAEFSAETPLANKHESVKVTFEKGTDFRWGGSELKGKLLILSLLHFDARQPSSLQAFPGGLLATGVTLPDGSTGNLNFSTAGFFKLQLGVDNHTADASGREFKMTASVDAGLLNPETGKQVAAGDKIGLWYYQDNAGKWIYLKDISLNSSNGKLVAGFNIWKAGWYSLNWYTVSCTNTLKVNVVTRAPNAGNRYIAAFFNSTDFFPFYTQRLDLSNSNTSLTYKNLPQSATKVRIFEADEFNTWLASGTKSNMPEAVAESNWVEACASEPVTLEIPYVPAVDITLDYVGFCPSNTKLDIRLSMYVFYREAGAGPFQLLGYMDKGHLVTNMLKIGKTYDLKSNYNNETIQITQIIDGTYESQRFQIPASSCAGF